MTDTVTLAHTREELSAALAAAAGDVALVPTMGALHEGHASLMRTARRRIGPDALLVVSVFVNPMQFAPGEDLSTYPRSLDADLDLCAGAGVDLVFAPGVDEVYPGGEAQVTLDPGPLASVLEGASRPTHFHGVLTVVAKLFGLVRPDVAVFGEKDFQQLALIRRMSCDLCLGVDVVGSPTVREPDGLALSSRNRHLDATARQHATVLSQALFAGQAAAAGGPGTAEAAARAVLRGATGVDLDYLALTGPDLGPAPVEGEARLLVAARVGGTRLIDNVSLSLGTPGTVTAPVSLEGSS